MEVMIFPIFQEKADRKSYFKKYVKQQNIQKYLKSR